MGKKAGPEPKNMKAIKDKARRGRPCGPPGRPYGTQGRMVPYKIKTAAKGKDKGAGTKGKEKGIGKGKEKGDPLWQPSWK